MGEPCETKRAGWVCMSVRMARSLGEPLRLQRGLDLRPCRSSRDVLRQHGPLAQIDSDRARPTQHCEQVRVRYGELASHQVILALKLRAEPAEPSSQLGALC